jgi:hypothetical protein
MDWLSIASAIHNNQWNNTTNLSPNQILWGHEVTLMPNNDFPIRNQMASNQIEDLKRKQELVITALNKIVEKVPALSPYQVGDQVWLEATHLHLPYQSSKLAPKHHGPFSITKEISLVAY